MRRSDGVTTVGMLPLTGVRAPTLSLGARAHDADNCHARLIARGVSW